MHCIPLVYLTSGSATEYEYLIGASVSEPHTSELAGRFSIYMYVWYVRDSVYLHPAPICAGCNISILHVGCKPLALLHKTRQETGLAGRKAEQWEPT